MGNNFIMKSRHGTVYYFRRRVPDCLQKIIGKPSLVKSLNTSHKQTAILLARLLAAKTDQLFYRLRHMAINPEDEHIRAELILEIDINEFGKPEKIKVQAEPHEQEIAQAIIAAAMGNTPLASKNQPQTQGKPFDIAIAEYREKSGLKPTSLATHKSKFDHAHAYFGENYDVLLIEQRDFTNYCDHVVKTVKNTTTQGNYMQTVSSFLNWHRIRAGLVQLTTKTLIPKRTTPESDDRDGFTIEEILVLFKNAAKYFKTSPCKFWVSVSVPLLGCRLEEIAQININTDLVHDEDAGIWYIRVDELPDAAGDDRKSVKKPSSWRHVPIHSGLVRHGFVDFLLAQRDAGFSRPFEREWQPYISQTVNGKGHSKWGHPISKWGGRELDKLDKQALLKKGKCSYFHSTRHTFSGVLGDAGVSSEIVEALCGRRYGGADQERYAKLKKNHRRLSEQGVEMGLGKLLDVLDKVMIEII